MSDDMKILSTNTNTCLEKRLVGKPSVVCMQYFCQ